MYRCRFPFAFPAVTEREGILRWAIISRCLVIIISSISNFIIPDHNATDVFLQPEEGDLHNEHCSLVFDGIVRHLLGGLARWDAQYFLHIAKHGYVWENSVAFFPLFPILSRYLSYIVGFFLYGVLSDSSMLLLSATIVNFAAFLKAADVLYTLSLRILVDKKLAYYSAVLFCFNPASIFFTAPYSESLFTLLTFSGIYQTYMARSLDYNILGSFLLGLSTGTRSNGILNIGFVIHKQVFYLAQELWPNATERKSWKPLFSVNTVKCLLLILTSAFIVMVPFVSFQAYCYYIFCTPNDFNMSYTIMNYAVKNNLILPTLGGRKSRPSYHWCHSSVPLAYSYVQNHYWNVGFLKYFQLAQIPNFLLAIPVVILILGYGIKFYTQHKAFCLKLGLCREEIRSFPKGHEPLKMHPNMFVFVVHGVALTMFCFFCIHVQVTTRMIYSASPLPYWIGAYILEKGFVDKVDEIETLDLVYYKRKPFHTSTYYARKNEVTKYSRYPASTSQWNYLNTMDTLWFYIDLLKNCLNLEGILLVAYHFFYFLSGTVLFSNFFPWT